MAMTEQCIDGVYRRTYSVHVPIGGVHRESDILVRMNGVWRTPHKIDLELSDLIGFRIIYAYDPLATFPEFPWLKSRKDLPVAMTTTGIHQGSMDFSMKGVLFEYGRELPYNEGICMYRATMYAEFADDILIPINPHKPDLEPWTTNRELTFNIQIQGYEAYEKYGYYVSGWNSIFHKKHFLDENEFPDKEPYKNINRINSYDIFPASSRNEDFSSEISIGIARNLTTTDRNMVGSSGALDHTYKAIYVDGEPKPFVVEVYH